ncbi:MAG: hypothetical protein ACRDQ0_12190 [Pseudonocardia sp.]
MTPIEQLLAEAIPDGTFGGPRPHAPEPPKPPAPIEPTSPEDQARHRAALLEGIAGHHVGRTRPPKPHRHLHAVPPAA